MSGTAHWEAIPRWPILPFEASVLSLVAGARDTAFNALLERDFVSPDIWSNGIVAISRLFGLSRESHCFEAVPHTWANFLEPQVTKGFVHFLQQAPLRGRIDRCLAFARAACLAAYGTDELLENIRPYRASALPEEGRSDILIELHTDDGIYGVVIEAKIGAALSDDQLEKYRLQALERTGWCPSRSIFLVVLSSRSAQDHRVLADNPEWSHLCWWDFLRLVESKLDPVSDSDEYRRFRRTVWRQTY